MAQTLQSVSQALKILELLQQHPSLGVSDISELLAVSPSTAHRLLSTLLESNFVKQEQPGRKYQLGPLMSGSRTASAVEHCIEIATPHMLTLRDTTQETVHLATLTRAHTRFVAAYESPHIMRVTSRVGRQLPAHATAAGKILLSALSDAELAELYPEGDLAQPTTGSIGTAAELRRHVAHAREVGYARNMSEAEPGVGALAVPLRHPAGGVVCSLTVTGPDARLNPTGDVRLSAHERDLLRQLSATARSIEAELRY
ncbi:IclR family transcriptional regulator [Klugiella xanthotipulae]|uniref:IclR family transcriptional regulator n=1 Tax=Klugiella xanthotipulae TaxID=244735 RepID=A0A543I774_9MICO|nr:IclR family transcriptional regulator [Klugiella xanthotipulae]TQM66389.1 IclR family transcriptional regulator [Klugiella xanthotipulae]